MSSRSKWVKVCGTTYKKPCVVVVGIDEEFPLFGKITSVYIIDEIIVFSVLLLYTCTYNPHYHAFEVKNSTEICFVQYENLVSHISLHLKNNCDSLMVPIKHRLTF